jgi:hypothetical protein
MIEATTKFTVIFENLLGALEKDEDFCFRHKNYSPDLKLKI